MNNEMQFYVFIDAENINYNLIDSLMNEILKYGIISGKRAYADWSNPIYKNWPTILDKYGIRPFQQFHYDKDETDKAIIMDVMEIVYSQNNINGICIAANDHIYGSIARRVREKGKYFLGIGTKDASNKFIESCNSFINIDDIEVKEINNNTNKKSNNKKIKDIIIKAIQEIDEDLIDIATLANMLKKINPAFDPRTFGYTKLLNLLKDQKDYLNIEMDDRTPPVYYIELKK